MFNFLKTTFFIDGRHSPGKKSEGSLVEHPMFDGFKVQHFCWMNLFFRTNHVCCKKKTIHPSLIAGNHCFWYFLMGSNSIDSWHLANHLTVFPQQKSLAMAGLHYGGAGCHRLHQQLARSFGGGSELQAWTILKIMDIMDIMCGSPHIKLL